MCACASRRDADGIELPGRPHIKSNEELTTECYIEIVRWSMAANMAADLLLYCERSRLLAVAHSQSCCFLSAPLAIHHLASRPHPNCSPAPTTLHYTTLQSTPTVLTLNPSVPYRSSCPSRPRRLLLSSLRRLPMLLLQKPDANARLGQCLSWQHYAILTAQPLLVLLSSPAPTVHIRVHTDQPCTALTHNAPPLCHVSVLEVSVDSEWVSGCLQLLQMDDVTELQLVTKELTVILQRQYRPTVNNATLATLTAQSLLTPMTLFILRRADAVRLLCRLGRFHG